MKHFLTKEKELRMFVKAFPGYSAASLFAEDFSQRDLSCARTRYEPQVDLPDPQIINNILSYARSLEVLKPAAGAAMFLVKN